jgi:DNA-binding CsgD family transcriptional regulator
MQRIRRLGALSEREHEVLGLVRVGLTNEEIALRLDISVSGVKYHVSQILSKLGVSSRDEAAAVVLAEQQRPHWLGVAVWAKIAGAATVAAAVTGLAVLALGVIAARDGDNSVGGRIRLRDNAVEYFDRQHGFGRAFAVCARAIEISGDEMP